MKRFRTFGGRVLRPDAPLLRGVEAELAALIPWRAEARAVDLPPHAAEVPAASGKGFIGTQRLDKTVYSPQPGYELGGGRTARYEYRRWKDYTAKVRLKDAPLLPPRQFYVALSDDMRAWQDGR